MCWLGPIIFQKVLIYTICTHFSHQVINISEKKNYTSFNINYNNSRNVEIVNFFSSGNVFQRKYYICGNAISFCLPCIGIFVPSFFFFFSNFGNSLLTFIILHYNAILCESGFVLLWLTRSQVTGWNPLEGFTKSSCEKLRLGGTFPASNSRKG
jgi:hypothetical protein